MAQYPKHVLYWIQPRGPSQIERDTERKERERGTLLFVFLRKSPISPSRVASAEMATRDITIHMKREHASVMLKRVLVTV